MGCMTTGRAHLIYISRPVLHWATGAFIFGLLLLFFVMAIREGTPLLEWRAWPAYAVTALFAPFVFFMLSRPAISVVIDDKIKSLVITQRGLAGSGTTKRVALATIAAVETLATETSDGDTYHVDILDVGGNRHRVTAHQIDSGTRAEAIAASIRAQIEAA